MSKKIEKSQKKRKILTVVRFFLGPKKGHFSPKLERLKATGFTCFGRKITTSKKPKKPKNAEN